MIIFQKSCIKPVIVTGVRFGALEICEERGPKRDLKRDRNESEILFKNISESKVQPHISTYKECNFTEKLSDNSIPVGFGAC